MKAFRSASLAFMTLIITTSFPAVADPDAGCLKDGEATIARTACCSRFVVPKVVYCPVSGPCQYVCGTRPVTDHPCVPKGGVDDVLSWSNCCSGSAVAGSTRCLNQADYGTSWQSCTHLCN